MYETQNEDIAMVTIDSAVIAAAPYTLEDFEGLEEDEIPGTFVIIEPPKKEEPPQEPEEEAKEGEEDNDAIAGAAVVPDDGEEPPADADQNPEGEEQPEGD